jgi:hypothetical protein
MPLNYYVNVFYTNRYQQYATNFVEIFSTNWTTLTVTNPVHVDRLRTNHTSEYHTNWITLNLTNEVGVQAVRTNVFTHYRTNLHDLQLTNDLAIELTRTNYITRYRTNLHRLQLTNELALNEFHTNFVDRYRTNVKTLVLTNWEQVLVMKTNWITQPITNVVQLDLVAKNPEPALEKETPTEVAAPVQSLPSPSRGEGVEIRASLASTPGAPGQPEVQLRARWNTDPSIALHVEQWRIESQDSAILLFGQGQEFRRQLPIGRYKVEVKVRREVNGPVLAGNGVLDLSGSSATVLQKLLGQN